MRAPARRLARYVRRAIATVVGPSRQVLGSRSRSILEYFAIHDGRTLNASTGEQSNLAQLMLDGPISVMLPKPVVEGPRRVWVVDLLGHDLPAGEYLVRGEDAAGGAVPVRPVSVPTPIPGEPALDAKIIGIDSTTASVSTLDGVLGIEITDGDPRARLAGLNHCGPTEFTVTAPSVQGSHRIVAIERESAKTVDVGELRDGIGVLHLTRLESPVALSESRWDVDLRDDEGHSQRLHGPATDYARPDQATSFGDLSLVRGDTDYRWKPYVARDGGIAVRVTAESRGSVT